MFIDCQKKTFGYDLFSDYKKIFNNLNSNYKNKALRYSKKQCLKRFDGKIGVNMHYSTKSAFSKYDDTDRVLNNNNKKNF